MTISNGFDTRGAAISDRILSTITLIFGVVALPALLLAVFGDQEHRSALEPFGYWAIYSAYLTIGILLRRVLDYRIRAYATCIVLLMIGVLILTQRGLGSGAELFLCTSCGIATALIGQRAGARLMAVSILGILGIGWLVINGILPIGMGFTDEDLDPTNWLMATLVFTCLVGALVVTLRTLREGLFEALGELEKQQSELEQLVAVRTAELKATNEELESFAHAVSHDLRAPLRAIDGFSSALSDDHAEKLSDSGKGHLARVREGVRRMTLLIDALLQLSRLTRSSIRFETIDLSALATEISHELSEHGPDRQVKFVIAPHLRVRGDRTLLRVALMNLLSNSWKFTSHHDQARIEVGCQSDGGERVFFVRDDGAGFDMMYVDRLFQAFQRLHGMDQFEGTGMGLALVHRVIRRHGGRVWAEGEIEQGATVYFTLPEYEE